MGREIKRAEPPPAQSGTRALPVRLREAAVMGRQCE